MDPEIVKTATELAKAAGTAAGLSIPFTGIVKRMLGPAADELAEMWRDQVRLYRYERQLKCVQKAERMAQEAGFTPLLEGASFEDDENLHDMWAALLANAASPENAEKVRPGFAATLKQMAADEARMLEWLLDKSREWRADFHYEQFREAYVEAFGQPKSTEHTVSPADDSPCFTCIGALLASGLIEKLDDAADEEFRNIRFPGMDTSS
jgi:hypothetical protein